MPFEHWLSYSHTDQALLVDDTLDATWDGLVVPGTLAAYYFEGTGGFVLARRRPYIIDPRTPLLQPIDRRTEPKVSQLELAKIHAPDLEGLWPTVEIELGYWQDDRWSEVVHRVLDFQERYANNATGKIAKYQQLLVEAGQTPDIESDPESPTRYVPPYFAADGPTDPWWSLTREAIEISARRFGSSAVYPVLALRPQASVDTFAALIRELPAGMDAVFCWRGSWQEQDATEADVTGWATTIQAADERGIRVLNLYGGYLSVLMGSAGLAGVNHGIGYSEARDVARLSETGAPPTRYYVPAFRRFVPRAQAQPLIDGIPQDWRCPCSVCAMRSTPGTPPLLQSYSAEDLKRHFLLCRGAEIERVQADPEVEIADLRTKARWLADNPPRGGLGRGFGQTLSTWAASVEAVIGG